MVLACPRRQGSVFADSSRPNGGYSKDITGAQMSSCERLGGLRPGVFLVVGRAGLEAAVRDADDVVGDLVPRRFAADIAGSLSVMKGACTGRGTIGHVLGQAGSGRPADRRILALRSFDSRERSRRFPCARNRWSTAYTRATGNRMKQRSRPAGAAGWRLTLIRILNGVATGTGSGHLSGDRAFD
jgi:hypothetical protein